MGQPDQLLVAVLAAQLGAISGGRPELVVAGHPDELREFSIEQPKGEFDLFKGIANVSAEDEPILGMFGKLADRQQVLFVPDVDVADGEELHGDC